MKATPTTNGQGQAKLACALCHSAKIDITLPLYWPATMLKLLWRCYKI